MLRVSTSWRTTKCAIKTCLVPWKWRKRVRRATVCDAKEMGMRLGIGLGRMNGMVKICS